LGWALELEQVNLRGSAVWLSVAGAIRAKAGAFQGWREDKGAVCAERWAREKGGCKAFCDGGEKGEREATVGTAREGFAWE